MRLPDGLRKHGFRKWYERELIQSHVHLVLTLGCTLGLLGTAEVFSSGAPLPVVLGNVLAVVACAGIGLWALRRYLYLLMHAEETANQAVCPSCATYGRIQLVAENQAEQRITVRCRACGQHWSMTH